jgi:hypothetical protein
MDSDNKIIAGTCYSITGCKNGFGTRILRGFRPNGQPLGEACGSTFSKLVYNGFFGVLVCCKARKWRLGNHKSFISFMQKQWKGIINSSSDSDNNILSFTNIPSKRQWKPYNHNVHNEYGQYVAYDADSEHASRNRHLLG